MTAGGGGGGGGAHQSRCPSPSPLKKNHLYNILYMDHMHRIGLNGSPSQCSEIA